MPFINLINTEMQLAPPLDMSFEAVFGPAALKLLQKGDTKSLEKLMELYGQSKDLAKEVEKLLKKK